MAANNDKGDILEDLTGLLHEGGAQRVDVRTTLPCVLSKTRVREIDVLVTSDIMAMPIRTVIECKNHGAKIGIERIDAFVGVLDDVGVPKTSGIFVSPIGFTEGALARAAEVGIRTLLFSGLTADRLAEEISAALQSVVYLVATWRTLNRFPYLPQLAATGHGIQVTLDPLRHGSGEPALLNAIWEQWLGGAIPSSLGEHVLTLSAPFGETVIAEVEVSAHVAVLKGKASRLALSHAGSGVLDKLRIRAEFEPPGSRIDLIRFDSNDELKEHFAQGVVHAYSSVRVPRIVSTTSFWPPSKEAVRKLRELIESKQEINFESVEGSNILKAWATP